VKDTELSEKTIDEGVLVAELAACRESHETVLRLEANQRQIEDGIKQAKLVHENQLGRAGMAAQLLGYESLEAAAQAFDVAAQAAQATEGGGPNVQNEKSPNRAQRRKAGKAKPKTRPRRARGASVRARPNGAGPSGVGGRDRKERAESAGS
jgi:hypothetical protein